MREQKTAYIMVAPAIIVLAVLMAYPFFMSIAMSLTNKLIGVKGSFIGLRNFTKLLHDTAFQQTLRNSVSYTVISVLFKTILGLSLALILTKIKGRRVLQAVLLLPWVIPSSLSALSWWWMFNPLFGVINWVFKGIGLSPVPWLHDPLWAKAAVISVNIWRGLPFFAICFLAGLTSISHEFYEAAELDGAGANAKFWYVTIPLLKPTLAIVVLYSIVMTFANFEIIWIITKGGPREATHIFGTLAFQIGLVGTRIGEGAAISLFMFPILALSAYFFLKIILSTGVEIG